MMRSGLFERFRPGFVVMGLVAVMSGSFATSAAAQGSRQERPSRAEMESQFRERFQADVRRRLGLTEAQSNAVQAIVEDMQSDRRTLAMREVRLQRRMASDTTMTEAQSEVALDELVAIKREESRLMTVETARLRDVLPAAKVIAFYQLREEMGRRIRTLRGGGAEWGGGMPRPNPVLGASFGLL